MSALKLTKFRNVFKRTKDVIIGMLHLPALPGCPMNRLSVPEICDVVLQEGEIYLNAGMDAVMVENMHDVPYIKGHEMGPEIIAAMAAVSTRLRYEFPNIPLGIQVLTAGNKEAISIAKCTGLNFIRAEGFVYSHIGDEGFIDSTAGSLLRYRKTIAAEDVLIFADVKKKHSSHAITNDVSIRDTARAMQFFLADGVIVTGTETGVAAAVDEFLEVQTSIDIPVLVGSGITKNNVHKFLDASALIVGSHFKKDGLWYNKVDKSRVEDFMRQITHLRTERG